MRSTLATCLFILSFVAQAQLTVKAIRLPDPQRETAQDSSDYRASLPFWDDFSTSGDAPDTLLWASGPDVFVNATLGQNPPTYKVATFDGLSSTGRAHDIANDFNGPTDSLVSHPIDLSQVSSFNRSSVYLSFFWQARGFGEIPDEKDSLALFFYRLGPDSTYTWDLKWSVIGGPEQVTETFNQEILQVDSSSYFHDRFQFKWVSYSSQKGPFDTWHLDYIYLNQNRSIGDISHFDRSLSGSASPLLSPYFEIPADHFFNNPSKYLTNQHLLATNLDAATQVGHPLDYYYQLENLTTNELYHFQAMGNGGLGGLGPLEYREIEGPLLDTIAIPTNSLDSQVIASTFYYLTNDKRLFEEVNGTDTIFLPIDLRVNDTIRTTYTLHDHYAYDDGTAEFAAAINVLRGQVAVRYALEEPDTLTHVDIHFPNIAPDATGSSLDILVWDRLEDARILARQPFTVQSPDGLNEFSRIKLNRPILTKDTIYVGYQQFSDNYLGVGFDRNNPMASGEIFTNVNGVWEKNTRLSGALMIRPVFGYDSSFLLSTPRKNLAQFTAYPNPNQGLLSIDGKVDQLSIFNLTGQLLYSSEQRQVYDISFLEDGIYLLKISNNHSVHTQKLIVRK